MNTRIAKKKILIKRLISFFLISGLCTGSYYLLLNNKDITKETEITNPATIKRIYETGENAGIMTIKNINTVSVKGVCITIPAFTHIKTYAFENSLTRENIYSFKYRGLDIEYEVEYKDKTIEPTVLLFKDAYIYTLNTNVSIYESPDINSKRKGIINKNTTIITEYNMENGWVYCITGNKQEGWIKLSPTKETTQHPTYKEAKFLLIKTGIKPDILFDNISLFLNQFPNVKGITITTLEEGV